MKQKTIIFYNKDNFIKELEILKKEYDNVSFFRIYAPTLDESLIRSVTDIVSDRFPESDWFGGTCAGSISGYKEYSYISVTAVKFESPDSRFHISYYDMANEKERKNAIDNLQSALFVNTWVKGIEVLMNIPDFSIQECCRVVNCIKNNVKFFGGIHCSPSLVVGKSIIFSKGFGFKDKGVITVGYGGKDFYIETIRICGWKPVGRVFKITKAHDSIIEELDEAPAINVYRDYLGIENDENIFANTLEFPLMYKRNDTEICRTVSKGLKNGAIVLSSEIEEGGYVRLAYGDPETIKNDIADSIEKVRSFTPDVIHVTDCAARKEFWGYEHSVDELSSFRDICHSQCGYFSHGEFIKTGDFLDQHNTTLIVTMMREGEEHEIADIHFDRPDFKRMPFATRMANFISKVTYEMEEANDKLRALNSQLAGIAEEDALTGLGNRYAFEKCLDDIYTSDIDGTNYQLLMCDVNGLKYVNDTFGHDVGDELIRSAANLLRGIYGQDRCFRIGGDEFTVVLETTPQVARQYRNALDALMEEYNKTALHRISIAIGESFIRNSFISIKSKSDWKLEADLDMYSNKALAYNQRKSFTENDTDIDALMACLIGVIESRDAHTAHHSERVRLLSVAIAKMLNLTKESVDLINKAALLHDIGKIAVPDFVLFTTGKLKDEEFEIVKEHVIAGANILTKSSYAHTLVDAVLHHHERWDGSGYPDNLAGKDIPLESRIIAIADSIDAIASNRCYKPPLPLAECKEEIEINAGKMYDPVMTEVVLHNWKDIEEIMMANIKNII